jgi:hypothetical protein
MKSIKFLRNVAVNAIHHEQGSVHDIEDKDADLIIAQGAGVLFTPPAKESIETTEAKHPGKEKAAKR